MQLCGMDALLYIFFLHVLRKSPFHTNTSDRLLLQVDWDKLYVTYTYTVIIYIMFCFVTNKNVYSNINKNKVCLRCYCQRTLNKVTRELVLYILCYTASYFFSLFLSNKIYWVRNIFDFFFFPTLCVVVSG